MKKSSRSIAGPHPMMRRQVSDNSLFVNKFDLGGTIREVLKRVRSLVDSDLSKENIADLFVQ